MRRTAAACIAFLLAATADAADHPLVIVYAPALAHAAAEWAAVRAAQGWTPATIATVAGESPDDLASRVRGTLGEGRDGAVVLLLGDVGPEGVPTFHFDQTDPALRNGGEATFASDHPYALPASGAESAMIAVGRVPARTESEALAILAKIRRYEETAPVG